MVSGRSKTLLKVVDYRRLIRSLPIKDGIANVVAGRELMDNRGSIDHHKSHIPPVL